MIVFKSKDKDELYQELVEANERIKIIGDIPMAFDGPTVAIGLDNNKTRDMIVKILSQLTIVVFSRMNPSQKGAIATIAKRDLKLNVLAIGDGHNDDIMLGQADIGIKITHSLDNGE